MVAAWLVPRETAVVSAHVFCTPFDHTPVHSATSFITVAGNSCVEGFLSCGGFCISPDMRCNGIPNCPDGRDERGCPRVTGAGGTRRVGLGHPGGRRDDVDVSTGKTFEGQPAEDDDKTGDTSNS